MRHGGRGAASSEISLLCWQSAAWQDKMRLTDRGRIALCTELFLKAAGLHVQVWDFRTVRRSLKLDGTEPMDSGDNLTGMLRDSSPGAVHDVVDSLSTLCRGNIIGSESIRVLFREEARVLNPKLMIAHRLGAPKRSSSRSSTTVVGMLTVCNFVQEEALATQGVRAALRRHRREVNLDDTLLIDVVCARDQSAAGRALLGQLLSDMLHLRRGARARKSVLSAVAVSASGVRLLSHFGFESINLPSGHQFMWLNLKDVDASVIESALAFENQDRILSLCLRQGLTQGSRGNCYLNGC